DLERERRRGAGQHDRDAACVRDGIARDLDQRPDARARDEQPLMRPRRLFMHRILIAAAVAVLAGCASAPHEPAEDPRYEPASPAARAPAAAPGTIYRGGGLHLFMDLRAHDVGDVLTVRLVERTNASKESSASSAKSTEVDTGFPIFGGRPVTRNGTPILNNEISSERSFSGQADASQSNRLDGSVAVTVAERLPNGNLLVRGEKWITLNNGEELIRFSGIVRPVDIGPDNTI